MHLFDVSLLYALVVDDHPMHESVLDWNELRRGHSFATCAITEAGLIRLLMNASLQSSPLNVTSALELLRSIHADLKHIYIESAPSLIDLSLGHELQRVRGHRQITDAYLIALAKMNGCKLATLDGKLLESFGREHVEVIPIP